MRFDLRTNYCYTLINQSFGYLINLIHFLNHILFVFDSNQLLGVLLGYAVFKKKLQSKRQSEVINIEFSCTLGLFRLHKNACGVLYPDLKSSSHFAANCWEWLNVVTVDKVSISSLKN